MHPSIISRPIISRASAVLSLCLGVGSAMATDGTWTRTNATTMLWGDSANWASGQIADGVGSLANFTATQGGTARTVNIDTTSRTVGVLNVLNQHSNGTSGQSMTFGTTTGNTLTFDNGVSAAQLNIVAPSYSSTGTNTFSVGILLGSSLDINNARPLAANTLMLSGTISAASSGTKVLSNVSSGPAGVTVSGTISDGAGVVAVRQNSTAGVLTLSGSNSYTGGTYIDAGIVQVAADNNFGATSSGVFVNGGTIRTTTGLNTASSLRILDMGANGGTFDTNGVFTNWYGAVTGTGTLYKTGGSVLSLNGTNSTLSGGISVLSGTLRVRNGDGAFGATANGVTLANGTELLIQDAFTANAARTLTLTSGTAGMDIRADFGWQGVITGTATMMKLGASMLTLTGTNTYVGSTLINAGIVQIDNDLNLGNAANGVILNTGTLRVTNVGSATGLASSRTLTLSGTGNTLVSDKFINWDGQITGSSALSKAGSSTLSLNNAANDFTGNVAVNAGVLRLRAGDTSLGNADNDVAFANNTTFRIQHATSATLTNLNANRTLSLSGTTTVDTITALQVSGTITGAGGIVKTGTGTFIASGFGNYAGGTGVTEGTMIVNGDFSGVTGGFGVSSGATLGGSGTIGSSVSVLGTIAAGNSIGTLSVQSLNIGSTGTLGVELGRSAGTPVNDVVNVTGSVILDGGANLSLTLYSGLDNAQIGDVFYLLNNDGVDAIGGVFTNLNGAATTLNEGSTFIWNSLEWTITYQADAFSSFTGGNDLAIMATAVPEPSTYLLIGAGLAVAFLRRRKK